MNTKQNKLSDSDLGEHNDCSLVVLGIPILRSQHSDNTGFQRSCWSPVFCDLFSKRNLINCSAAIIKRNTRIPNPK